MIKSMKRIISFVIIITMCIGSTSIFAESEGNAVAILKGFGIIQGVEYPFFESGFSRQEFAKVLTNLMFGSEPPVYSQKFAPDIGGKYINYINYVLDNHLMETDAEGNFKPNGDVTYGAAVKSLLSVIGYDLYVEKTDGDYITFANKIGVSRGVSVKNYHKISQGELAKMLLNTMRLNRIELIGNTWQSFPSIMEERNIKEYEGRILANENIGIASEKCREKHVNIDGKVMQTNMTVTDDMVGSYVVYYVNEDGSDKIVMTLYTKLSVDCVEIVPQNIYNTSFTAKYLEILYDEQERIRIPYTANILINGKPSDITSSLMNAFENGKMLIYDTDHDGSYDFVNMTILKTDVIVNSNAANKTILTRYNKELIHLSMPDSVTVYKNNEKATIEDIRNDDVISIACDKFFVDSTGTISFDYASSSRICLYLTDRVISGRLEGIDTANSQYVINNTAYKKGNLIDIVEREGEKAPLRVGEEYLFKVDSYNTICDYDLDESVDIMQYGYLIESDLELGMDNQLKIRLLNSDNIFVVCDVDDTFYLNGIQTRCERLQTLPPILQERQLIRYRLINGKVKYIDTSDAPNSSLSLDSVGTDMQYTEKLNGFSDYKTKVTKNTVVFFVPNKTEVDVEDKNFSAGGVGLFSNNMSYTFEGYNIGDMGSTGCIVVYSQATKTIEDTARFYMVGKISESIVGDEIMSCWTLYGHDGIMKVHYDPQKVTYTDSSNALLSDQSIDNVKKGDLVRFSKTFGNELLAVERVFSVDANNDCVAPEVGGPSYQYPYAYLYNRNELYFEFVTARDDLENVTDSEKYCAPFMEVASGGIPVYNMHNNTITLVRGNYTEIPSFISNGEKVTIKMFWGYHKEMYSAAVYIWD